LEQNFIYPNSKSYADMLRSKVKSGAYSKFVRSEFTRVVTADLQAVHPEGHLKLPAQSQNAAAMQPLMP